MMRAVLSLALIASAGANCALHGAEAVDELLDSAVFIWASVERCGQPGETVRCEVNVASAIEAVNGMLNVITKAVHECGGLKDAKCGLAAGALTESFAGVAAASGGVVAQCPNDVNGHKAMATVGATLNAVSTYGNAKFGACVVDVKDTMRSLFKAIKRIMTVKHNCAQGERDCIHNSLKIVAGFASLGEYLGAAIGHCHGHAKTHESAMCASQSLKLINELNNVAKAGVAVSQDCHAESDSRLYLLDEEEAPTSTSSSSVTLALAALLPMTAVISFVGGSRLAKARSQTAPQDFESLMPLEEM